MWFCWNQNHHPFCLLTGFCIIALSNPAGEGFVLKKSCPKQVSCGHNVRHMTLLISNGEVQLWKMSSPFLFVCAVKFMVSAKVNASVKVSFHCSKRITLKIPKVMDVSKFHQDCKVCQGRLMSSFLSFLQVGKLTVDSGNFPLEAKLRIIFFFNFWI